LSSLDALEDIEIVRFDAFTYMRAIVQHPRRFGLSDATNACITPGVPPYFCPHPDRQFFWDGIHTTRAGHRIIAFLAGKTLLVELLQHD
jgi:phospholipase/lecithinase/hemolysin